MELGHASARNGAFLTRFWATHLSAGRREAGELHAWVLGVIGGE